MHSCRSYTAYRTRAVEVLLGLLVIQDGKIADSAAWMLREVRTSLAPYESRLRAALETTPPSARPWVQDVLDAIEDGR